MPSKIEWTDETWNPIVGCSRVSPGCTHCYAIRTCARGMAEQHVGLTLVTKHGRLDWTGEVRPVPHRMLEPLHWSKPRRCFVNSLSDLFHESIDRELVAEIFAVMSLARAHTFQVLTKRAEHMFRVLLDSLYPGETSNGSKVIRTPSFAHLVDVRRQQIALEHGVELGRFEWPLPNVWLGVSIEGSIYSHRAGYLRDVPAAKRFVSAEPLLGSLVSQPNGGTFLDPTGLDWIIVGGESGGRDVRPMHTSWARELRDLCAVTGTDFTFKQWGEWAPIDQLADVELEPTHVLDYFGRLRPIDAPAVENERLPIELRRVTKALSGRSLDGRHHDEQPAPIAAATG